MKVEKRLRLMLLIAILAVILSSVLMWEKVFRGEKECNCSTDKIENTQAIDLQDLSSLILIKNEDENVLSYKGSSLDDQDINDMIMNFLYLSGEYLDDGNTIQYRADVLEKKIIAFLGLKDYHFDLSKGNKKYTKNTLKEETKFGDRYYVIERNGGMFGDNFHFWNMKNISYVQNKLIIECEVELNYIETSLHSVLGLATITINMKDNQMLFESFNFSKYDEPIKVDTLGMNF